ncbi:GNAT family N-acetyltransferase [Staphylococcus lentus]|uniref:GNAT family N-acetyltransferase n=1 Tax=Mammaliicoccus lentus TaxID=42858 RepID=UPI0018844913|nr:GNAT family N-acetyltransferase [Mammaliicoccus lentus]MBF0842057.1 GNAT family N-acetyltransferase [Mammaliicoccus lentus]
MCSVTIDKIKNEEVTVLSKICKQTFSDAFKHTMSEEDLKTFFKESYSTEALLDEMSNKQSWYFFARYNGEVAGYMKLNIGDAQTEPKGEDYLEVQRLYMYREFQSKGIGSILMEKAFEIARDNGKKKLWLGVWENNYRAIEFYERHGYKITGSHQFYAGNDISTDYIVETNIS